MSVAAVDRFEPGFSLAERLERDFGHVFAGLRPGDEVAIKANMFVTTPGYHTDLELLSQLAGYIKELGARPVIVERLDVLEEVCARHPTLPDVATVRSLEHVPTRVIAIEGATALRQDIAVPVIVPDCDLFVSAPQFRTHAGVLMSNAMKNLVGILPGYTTRQVHHVGLSEAIVDLNRIRPPDLIVADLINTIEGNYPISGAAYRRGLVLTADNVVAADRVAADLAGFDADQIEYLGLASAAGLGPASLGAVRVLGDLAGLRFQAVTDVPRPSRAIELAVDQACDACQRFARSAQEMFEPHLASGDRLLVAAGPDIGPKLEEYPARRAVIVGNCSYVHRRRGIYLEGCPPRALQARAVADFLEHDRISVPLHRNQCRWPVPV